VALLKINAFDVRSGPQLIEVAERITVIGEATNAEGLEVLGLMHEMYASKWRVTGSALVNPGGLFQIRSTPLSQLGEQQFLVLLAGRGELVVGETVEERVLKSGKWPVSDTATLFVNGRGSQHNPSSLAIIGLSGVAPRLREVTPVGASLDVEIAGAAVSPADRAYVILHVPHSDRCFIYGPGKADDSSGNTKIHGVNLQIPGAPRQARVDLVAIVSRNPLPTGPASWDSIRTWDVRWSPTVEVLFDAKEQDLDSMRVPFLSVVRIGNQDFENNRASKATPVVQNDEPVYIRHERSTQSSHVYVMTRYHDGPPRWFNQGPALPRGQPSPTNSEASTPSLLFLPRIQFVRPADRNEEDEPIPFDVWAVVSTDLLPNGWIDESFLSTKKLDSASDLKTVQAIGIPALAPPDIAIVAVGNDDISDGMTATVGRYERVGVGIPKDFPVFMRIWVGKRRFGKDPWSFIEATPTREVRFTPAITFEEPGVTEGTGYEIVALSTNGPLPARELSYEEFLPWAVSVSRIVTVEYSSGFVPNVRHWIASWSPSGTVYAQGDSNPGSGSASPTRAEAKTGMLSWIVRILAVLGLALLELKFQTLSQVAGGIARSMRYLLLEARRLFALPASLVPGQFVLGTTMLVLVLYMINQYYIDLLAGVARKVTGLDPHEAKGLALWVIIIVALLGVIADLAYKSWLMHRDHEPLVGRLFQVVFVASIFAAIILWVFEGGLYFSSFAIDAEGIVAPLGGIVFFLIAMAETIIFFFITELTLPSVSVAIVLVALTPIYLLERFFAGIEAMLSTISKRPAPSGGQS